MLQHSRRQAAGRWRRVTFVIWVALTGIAAIYMMVAAPFAPYFRGDLWVVGVIVPPLMIVLLGIGIGWLVWLVTSSRHAERDRAAPQSTRSGGEISDHS